MNDGPGDDGNLSVEAKHASCDFFVYVHGHLILPNYIVRQLDECVENAFNVSSCNTSHLGGCIVGKIITKAIKLSMPESTIFFVKSSKKTK